jgi:hypothetical protein
MKCIEKLVLVLPFLVCFTALAQQSAMEDDGSILLPAQKTTGNSIDQAKQQQLTASDKWTGFLTTHGQWSVLWNEATETPHRAFGQPIQISGFNRITKQNVKEAAMKFLRDNGTLLKLRTDELKFVRATQVNNKWYVSYVQMKEGFKVLLSEVELRMSSRGKVFALGADFYSNIPLSLAPTIPYAIAKARSTEGLNLRLHQGKVYGDGKLFILPVRQANEITYHLVYQVFVEANAPDGSEMDGNYVVYVDAHDGTVVWRYNQVQSINVRGKVMGDVQMELATDPYVIQNFAYQSVNLGSTVLLTDTSGRFTGDIAAPVALSAQLVGPYIDINRYDGPDATISLTVNPGDSVNIKWDDSNSHPAERDAFYHVNLVLSFLKKLDTSFVAMNYRVPCVVNYPLTCNAQWRGNEGMRFYNVGGGCVNSAQIPTVVYHEYGHGVNQRLYEQQRGSGMVNGSANEGTADILAALFVDDPVVGKGFSGPGTNIRVLQNTNRYPQNVSGEVHNDGLIIGGTFWDIRRTTSLSVARSLSHFAKYGTPDDPDLGTCYGEWFVETLIADDDDGNLANGTPHMTQISNAFGAHGIGSTLFFTRSFQHTPLSSTYDTTNAYPVIFVLQGTPIPGGDPDSLRVVFTTNGFQTSQAVVATEIGLYTYRADIPAQHGGSAVRYYVTAYDRLSNTHFVFPTSAPTTAWYGFLVGIHRAQAGVMYASSSSPTSKLYRVNTTTGAATEIGSLATPELQGLAIKPSTKELFGTIANANSSTFYRVSPTYGDASPIRIMPIANMRAIAFASNDDLYGATTTGRLYRINLTTGDTTYIGTASGIIYAGLSFSPFTGRLYGSVRPPIVNRDRIYTINSSTGVATLVGATGDGLITPSIAFGPNGTLYGLKGNGAQTNTLLSIDTTTGTGTTIGSTALTGLQAIAMRTDSLLTSVEGEKDATLPTAYDLSQNYPNPFNPTTQIRYGLPVQSRVLVTIYNIMGQEITRLHDGLQSAGYHEVVWNGLNAKGASVASSIYLYKLEASGENRTFTETKRMLLLK